MIAIYARVSTEEQAKKGYSLQDQIRECRRLAGNEVISEYVDEGISGEVLDRPDLSRLRKDVSKGLVSKVICLDPDRLSRKLVNQLILSDELEKKASIQFVNGEYADTAEGKLFYQLRGAISEFEKAKINERMSRGRKEKARQGFVVRDYSIYGYDYDKNTKSLVLNIFEAQIVRKLFEMFLNGNSITGIADHITKSGTPTKRGSKIWHRQVIRQILMNPTYLGVFYQNKWNCEGALNNKYKAEDQRIPTKLRNSNEWISVSCPQIITEEVFSHAKLLLEKSRQRSAENKSSYLLSGLLICSECGKTLVGRKTKSWGKKVFEYTDIKGNASNPYRGCGMKLRMSVLDNMVWETILKEFEAFNSFEEASEKESDELLEKRVLSKRLKEIKKTRKNILGLLSVANENLGKEALEDISRKLGFLHNEESILLLEEAAPSPIKKNTSQNSIKGAWQHYILNANNCLSFLDKKKLLRYMVKEITVSKDSIIIQGF